jgi:hypothetical protein
MQNDKKMSLYKVKMNNKKVIYDFRDSSVNNAYFEIPKKLGTCPESPLSCHLRVLPTSNEKGVKF